MHTVELIMVISGLRAGVGFVNYSLMEHSVLVNWTEYCSSKKKIGLNINILVAVSDEYVWFSN